MFKIIQLIPIFLCLSLLFSCDYKNELKIDIQGDIKFIGHKGSGSIDKGGNIHLLENTWDAIANAMNNLDGSEIDIQISADSTFWIFHDLAVVNCEDSLINFFLCSDADLQQISKCNYENSLIKLTSFISKAKSQNWKNKILNLDLKVLYNPEINTTFKSHELFLSFITNKLKNNFKNSQLDVLFEVFSEKEFDYFNRIFKGQTYLVNYSPTLSFIQKMNKKSTPVSLPIYDLPDSLDSNEVTIQNLWTINSANLFTQSLAYHPKILQSDNIPLMSFFKSLQNGKNLKCIASEKYHVTLKKDGFYSLGSLTLPIDQNILFQFETIDGSFPKDVLLTFSAFSEEGDGKNWIPIELNKNINGLHLMNSEYLEYLGASEVRISIWNKKIKELDQEIRLSQFIIE